MILNMGHMLGLTRKRMALNQSSAGLLGKILHELQRTHLVGTLWIPREQKKITCAVSNCASCPFFTTKGHKDLQSVYFSQIRFGKDISPL